MAWTDPAGHVWATSETVTAANMNTYIRLNLEETAADTATTAGDLVYADAANSMGSRLAHAGSGRLLVADASSGLAWRDSDGQVGDSSYTSVGGEPTIFSDLSNTNWGTGTTVAVTLTTDTQAMLWYGARYVTVDTGGQYVAMSYRISGSTTVAAATTWGTLDESSGTDDRNSVGRSHLRTGLTAGSNTFTIQALNSAGGATEIAIIASPWIMVQAL